MEFREDVIINIKNILPRLFWLRKEKIDGDTINVIWDNREANQIGKVMFKKAKNKWNTKPLMTSSYIITDADLFGVIDLLHKHVNFDEREYSEIKKILETMSKNILKR
jgi:hypothetical protein